MSSVRVLHVAPSLPYGGVQRLVAQVAEKQRARGIDARVLALYESPWFSRDLLARGTPFRSTSGGALSVRGCREFLLEILSTRADVVHLHGGLIWSNVLGLATKRGPWIVHFHNYPTAGRHLKSRMESVVRERLADAYIGVSRSVGDAISDSAQKRRTPVYTVLNAIEPSGPPIQRSNVSAERPLYGMATRFADDKGLWEFLEVAGEVLHRQPDARFALAGDGPLREPISQEVQRRGWTGNVSLPGHVEDVERFWRGLDVALFTAPREPFGLRILEPMAVGVPVVAFRTGYGSDELIRAGETGLQAPWGCPALLAEQCVAITSDMRLWRRISQGALDAVRHTFSLDRMCDELDVVYERVRHPGGT